MADINGNKENKSNPQSADAKKRESSQQQQARQQAEQLAQQQAYAQQQAEQFAQQQAYVRQQAEQLAQQQAYAQQQADQLAKQQAYAQQQADQLAQQQAYAQQQAQQYARQQAETLNRSAEELAKALKSAEDYKRKWYSVSAEYENYRKRMATATSQAYADGKAEAILKLLPVADNFGYAYDGAGDEKTRAGIEKIIKNFNNILLSLGVEEVPVAVGDNFDESVMEAIMNAPCGEGEEANKVSAVLKKGYKRDGKIIRFAQVAVKV